MIDVLAPVAVTSTPNPLGFNLTTLFTAISSLLTGGVLVALIKSRPHLKQIAFKRESDLLAERAKEMSDMRLRLERLEAERRHDVHRINNLTQCLDSLLWMIEMDPERAREAAERIKKMRADFVQAEATEKGVIQGAHLAAVATVAAAEKAEVEKMIKGAPA